MIIGIGIGVEYPVKTSGGGTVVSAVSIAGTAVVGQTLTVSYTITGTPTVVTRKWYRGATLISTSTSSDTYVLTQSEAGNTSDITCNVDADSVSNATSNTIAQVLDATVNAYLIRLSATPNATNVGVLNNFGINLKSAVGGNLATAFDYIGLRGISTANDSLLNFLSSSFSATRAGTLTPSDWVVNQGYTGDGINKILLVDYNPLTQGVNYTLNSSSILTMVHAFNSDSASACIAGSINNAATRFIAIPSGAGVVRINTSGVGTSNANTFTNTRQSIRPNSTTINLYNDGVADAANPMAQNSVAIPDKIIGELGQAYLSAGFNYSKVTLFATAYGRAFTPTEIADIRSAFVYLKANLI